MTNLILASCYLPLKGETLASWAQLHEGLCRRGAQLVLLSTAPEEEAPFPVLPLPYLLRHYAEWFPLAVPRPLPPLSTEDWDLFLLQSDAEWSNKAYAAADAWPGLLVCRKVARYLLQTLAPGAVLLWNSTHPQTAIFHHEAWCRGIPVFTVERGFLPGTMMLDAWGIQGASDAGRHWLAHDLPVSADVEALMTKATNYYLTHRLQKYGQPDFGGGGASLRQQLNLGDQRVIVFFGQGDAAGLHPREARAMRQNAPALADTRQCLVSLARAVAKLPDTVLLFKPHPLDSASYAEVLTAPARRVDNVNVHALIELADVVAAQFTTLQYETVFYDRPVLLLGRSAWWGRGCTYEVNESSDLLPMLQAAMARKDWPVMRRRAHRFIAWALENYLVGCHAGVPAHHTMEDLAGFLNRASWDSRQLGPVEGRCWMAMEQLSSWAGSCEESLEMQKPISA